MKRLYEKARDFAIKVRVAWEVNPRRFAVYSMTGASLLLIVLVGLVLGC